MRGMSQYVIKVAGHKVYFGGRRCCYVTPKVITVWCDMHSAKTFTSHAAAQRIIDSGAISYPGGKLRVQGRIARS